MHSRILLRPAAAALASLMAIGVPAAQAQEPSASLAPAEITFGAFITPNLTEDFWNGLVADYEAEHPGVKVDLLFPPSGVATDVYYKSLVASDQFPDVVTDGVGIPDYVKAGLLRPFEIDDAIEAVKGYGDTEIGGQLYSIPAFAQPVSLVFYNKQQWADAGLTDTPKTLDEFDAALAALKAAGKTPILTSGDWVPAHLVSYTGFTNAVGHDPNWMADRAAGKVKFAEGDFADAVNHLADWVSKGYFIDGAPGLTYDQLEPLFFSGQAATYPMGVWFAASAAQHPTDFEIGVFPMPSTDGTENVWVARNSACAVSASTPSPDAATNFCEWLAVGPGHVKFAQADSLFSVLQPPATYPMSPLQQEIADIVSTANITYSYDGIGDQLPVPGLLDAVTQAGQEILSGTSAQDALNELDAYWDSKSE